MNHNPTSPGWVPPLDAARQVASEMLDTYRHPDGDTRWYAEAYGALKVSLELVLNALDAETPPAEELISGTEPRTVTVHTLDHGDVTLTCPAWCVGHETAPQYRIDITHTSTDHHLHLPVHDGQAELMYLAFEERPFTATWPGTLPFVSVGIDGDHYPVRVDGLEAMADELERHATVLRQFAAQLAAILAGGEHR